MNKTLVRLSLAVATAAFIAGCASPNPDVTARQEQTIASNDQNLTDYDTFGRRWGQTPYVETKATPVEPVKTSCASEIRTGLIHLTKRVPAEAALGQEYLTEITFTAVACAANVVVSDRLPAGVAYVRSEPAATVEGDKLVWRVGDMDAGQTVRAKVWLRADSEGTFVNCAMVAADPRACAATFVGKPSLAIEKTGPALATIGSTVTYNIVVKNTGNSIAKNVTVSDTVPEGLSHASGQSELAFNVGDLGPGQSKPLSVTLKANKRGKVCNTAVANSSNAGKVSSEACTVIQQPGLKIEKSGDKEQITGRKANYEVVVFNTGDTALSGVSVVDTAPEGTAIAEASGASVSGNTATWKTDLNPGEKKSFGITLLGKTAGKHCNAATASVGDMTDSTQSCTLWRGVAGILLEVVDDPDPIQVGETTTYTITVKNQGFADLHNVKIVGEFDEAVAPVSSAEGTVSGQTVNFPTVAVLEAKKSFTYKVIVKGAKAGDSRNKVIMNADETTKSVEETESTTVY